MSTAEPESPAVSSPADRPSILVVDDDAVLRERMARAFRDRGHEVRTAGNYDAAMVAAREDSPEWAVVDLRMPGRSGLELVRDLKALDPATRVVVLTGYGAISTAVDAVKLGATHYLPKPADADEVLAALAREDEPTGVPDAGSLQAPSLATAPTSALLASRSRATGSRCCTTTRSRVRMRERLRNFASPRQRRPRRPGSVLPAVPDGKKPRAVRGRRSLHYQSLAAAQHGMRRRLLNAWTILGMR